MIRKALGLFAVAGGVALIACSSDDSASKYPSAASFCSALAQAECANTAGDCGVKIADCETARVAVCTTNANTATGEGRVYTSGNVDACISATTAVYASPTSATLITTRDDKCNRVFAGSKTKSQVCTNAYDCTGELVCDLGKNPTSGICADTTTKNLNDPCTDPGDICSTGLYCDVNATTGDFCHADRTLGQGCTATIPCVPSTYCDTTNTQTCLALGQSGDTCNANNQCTSTFCNASGKCATRLYPSETGTCADFGG